MTKDSLQYNSTSNMLGHLEGKHNIKDPSSFSQPVSNSIASFLQYQSNKAVIEQFEKNLIQ